ncbi:MAG: non-lysosomal glucosylceramidase [Melioribacteraceae bacterium]|nr:non-lysosomal glucosylceramidase [Melioribacteraceae bacterium]
MGTYLHANKLVFASIILLVSFFYTTKLNAEGREFNGKYSGENLNRVAFPLGGIGAGMICLEGTGAISNVSVRNAPNLFYEPLIYAALFVKSETGNIAKVIEGPVPEHKYFGTPMSGEGLGWTSYGLPRFESASFLARFPFGEISLEDSSVPIDVSITGWSPFIPGDADNSSLPVGALEYHFSNSTEQEHEVVFSFNSQNFMNIMEPGKFSGKGGPIKEFPNGFLLWNDGDAVSPYNEGGFAIFVDDENLKVNHQWFSGSHTDVQTINWKNISSGKIVETPARDGNVYGASLSVPFTLKPGEKKTIKLMFCWYVPKTNLKMGPTPSENYKPWYSGKFKDIYKVAQYWRTNYSELRNNSKMFTEAFYSSTLPSEVLEAVSANMTILKSPTVLRQTDGKLWGWEGSGDTNGNYAGSCSHVWNYAQAIPHLFPKLERTLRETEFIENQLDEEAYYSNGKLKGIGFQKFRAILPIRDVGPGRWAAIDGQFGGIMKIYRDWRISGNSDWLKSLWTEIKLSMEFCISNWDPERIGVIAEPQHNTYDIEFWGPTGMSMSFYAGALNSYIKMGKYLGEDVTEHEVLLANCVAYMEDSLFNGEYFNQQTRWEGMAAGDPIEYVEGSWNVNYSEDALKIYKKEGPKYQYGNGVLADGIMGLWLSKASGNDDEIINPALVKSHLKAVYKYNMKHDLSKHPNPQRPGYALGNEGGLLLCTWPHNDEPTLPFIYSNEVWTGIEYQVASHLIMEGMVDEGLDIVRTLRKRYNGERRNPFNEYEAGSWYARAMSSYSLLQALSGIKYDAVDSTLYIDSKLGDDFSCFFSTESGFGVTGLKDGKPFIDVKMGSVPVSKCIVSNSDLTSKLIEKK